MTVEQLQTVLTNLGVTPEQLTTFLGMGMASLAIDTLKNRIEKLRVDQTAYNSDIEAQIQALQVEINAAQAQIIGAV